MGKPRIYIAIATFLPAVGGAERQALAHGHGLRERGYEATVITLRHVKAWPRYEELEGVPVIRVAGSLVAGRKSFPGPIRKLAYLMGLVCMGWTLWWHRKQYDVLCVYQLKYLALPAAIVCLLTGKPLVINLRCATAGIGPSHGDGNAEIGDLETLARLGRPVLYGTRFLLHRTRAVLVVLSSRMQHELAVYGIHPAATHCIPNGVDVTRFVPLGRDPPTTACTQTVVCVSRLTYQKGIDVLLHAWQLVCAQAPHARLIIVGTGPLQHQLTGLANDLGVARTVEFAGLQTDVPAQLHRGGLAVLASRYEGMPNVVLEAMACGLPCVATRVSGSEDIIQHGVNGLLVAPDDAEGLARALLTLIEEPTLALAYGRAARATVEQNYAVERSLDRYITLYEQLADGRHT